jgi:hypothetical protein
MSSGVSSVVVNSSAVPRGPVSVGGGPTVMFTRDMRSFVGTAWVPRDVCSALTPKPTVE